MLRMDICIFGASGFTGKHTVKEIMKISKIYGEKFTWGVAGRNKEKLKGVLDEMSRKANSDLDTSSIPIIVADLQDEESLNEMAKKAKVILNCCGPYRFYGEPVVKACIANKTHHVDVSGEPQYMERMQLLYHESAKENEIYIVSACGFDSVPADLGVIYLTKQFEGEVNSVDIYLDTRLTNNIKSTGIHYGTWESAVYGLAHYNELEPLRRALYPNKLPVFHPVQKNRFILHKNRDLNKWCLPFPGSDRSVVKRSQRYLYENENQRPIQVKTYITFPNLLTVISVLFFSVIFAALTKFKIGRSMLLKYPKLFSLGYASHEGPNDEQSENTHFSMTFYGQGWNEKSAKPTNIHTTSPNKTIVTRVKGTNPGYGATCIVLILCGLTILHEPENMPRKGGVYPPGAAFAKTKLLDNLNKFGVTFEVLEDVDNKKTL